MIVVSFTYACNARCPNCPYNNSNIRKTYKDAVHIPEDLFLCICDEAAANDCVVRVTGGGEPLLHPKAIDLLVEACECGTRISLITNASLLTWEKSHRLLEAGIEAIECSVDAGNEQEYAMARPGLNFDEVFLSVAEVHHIRNLLNAKTRVVTSVINQKGIDVKQAEDFWGHVADKVQIRKFLTWGYNEDKSADPTPYMDESVPCPWLFERMNIDTRGDVTYCGEDIAFAHKFANIRTTGIENIWLGKEFTKARETMPEMCKKCPDHKYRVQKENYWKLMERADENRSNQSA
jgi:MoaA/NifB/PqqE/SkfB family radical SAM enzyme